MHPRDGAPACLLPPQAPADEVSVIKQNPDTFPLAQHSAFINVLICYQILIWFNKLSGELPKSKSFLFLFSCHNALLEKPAVLSRAAH